MPSSIAGETDRIQRATTERARSRALIAGCVGNLVEWYDFALYGAFAPVIARTFFPSSDPLTGLVAAFGVFGAAFVARPAGALVLGHLGDRAGRRRALAVSILLMALATAGIGLLPGFSQIGWLAPVLLVTLRVAQGLAVGGEFGGSAALVVEFAPSRRRGWYGGWQYATVGLGLAFGIGTAALLGAALSDAALHAWGWRLPFVVALALGLIGSYVRTRLDETPSFRAAQRTGSVSGGPVAEVARTQRPSLAIGFVLVAAVTVTFNVFYVFVPALLTAQRQVGARDAFGAAFVGLVVGSATAPVFGRTSDRVGRRPLLFGGVLALVVSTVPAFSLVLRGDPVSMVAGYLLVGVPLGSLALTAFLAELFPTPLRYSGLSLTYGIASAVFGGSAPLIAAALVERTGAVGGPAWYAVGLSAAALVGVLLAPETVARPLDEDP